MKSSRDFFSTSKKGYFLLLAALLPLSMPSLPGNLILVDLVNMGFFFLFIILFSIKRKQIKLQLVGPIAVILFGSLIAMFNTQALAFNIFTITQDLYLFVFFLVLYNIVEDQRDLKMLLACWLFFCVAQGGLAVLGSYIQFSVGSSGVSEVEDLSRSRGTFANSDALASYLGVSFFIIFQPFFKFGWFWNLVFGSVIFLGMFATKSMSALLGFSLGTVMVFVLYWLYIRGIKKLRLSIIAFIVALSSVFYVMPKMMEAENFLERMPRSAGARKEIWMAGYESFLRFPMGIGPGSFKKTGKGPLNREGKRAELHNDFISYLVERGPIGLIGLLILYGSFVLIVSINFKKAETDEEVLWALGLMGMLTFIMVDALNHEGMHYRHVWLAFGIIAAQSKLPALIKAAEDNPIEKKRIGN